MGFDLEGHAQAIERDGYTIIPDFIDATRLAEVRRVLAFYLGTHSGRNPFEGHSTERVYTLVARGKVFWEIALDARVLALCERFLLPNFLLTASQAICIRPGEQTQAFHHDDTFYTVPRPRPMISISTIAAVDEFTARTAAHQIIPGSTSGVRTGKNHCFCKAAHGAIRLGLREVLRHAGAPRRRQPARRRRGWRSPTLLPALARQQENFLLGCRRGGARDAAAPAGNARLFDHPPSWAVTASHPVKALHAGYVHPVGSRPGSRRALAGIACGLR